MTTILKTSHSQNNLDVFQLTTENHAEYCMRHGYTYHPVEEPYNPYVSVDEILGYLKEYDLVVTVGVDLLIQRPEMPLEGFAHDGVTMCRELRSGTLNADLILYSGKKAVEVLGKVRAFQAGMKDGQTALNYLSLRCSGIHEEPLMQLAAPAMNPTIDYSSVCIDDYFALHYHTIGKIPVVADKADGIRKDLMR